MSNWWLALVLTFIIQGIRSVFTFLDDAGMQSIFTKNPILDRTLMFVISLLIVVGLWTLLRNFENFEIIEKNVKQKLGDKKQMA